MANPSEDVQKGLRVFVSWSGDRSRNIAEALRTSLRDVFPDLELDVSTALSAGSRWQAEIGKNLDLCNFGIVCVTAENKTKPWLLFEAGALSKSQASANVVPYCFGCEPDDLPPALRQFQGVKADERGTFGLLRAINLAYPARLLHERQLELIFKSWWPIFEPTLTNLETSKDEDFSSFFGPRSPDGKYPAVFFNAGLESASSVGTPTNLVRLSVKCPPQDERGKKIEAYPEGIREILPYQELDPVLRLDREFRRSDREVQLCLDEFHEGGSRLPEYGCLSMGLGFNNLTVRLGKLSGLYRVTFPPGLKTDDFVITPNEDVSGAPQGSGQSHQIIPGDEVKLVAGTEHEWALLARILISQGELGLIPYLVCAGHTADGTAAACYYLAANWHKEIWTPNRDRLKNHHMAAILSHPKNERAGNQQLVGKPYFKPAVVGPRESSPATAAGAV